MSNPVVTIGNNIYPPADPSVVRKSYTQILFDEQRFFFYAEGENDTNFDPTDMGQNIFMLQLYGQIAGVQQPSFVSDDSWSGLQKASSAIITANHSIMPKTIIPSKILVDNGVVSAQGLETVMAEWEQGGTWKSLFNWYGTQCNGGAIANWLTEWSKYLHVDGTFGTMYATSRWKDDSVASNSLEINLDNLSVTPYPWPSAYPTGEWDSAELVVGGAFLLVLNVDPTTTGQTESDDNNKARWEITVQFGEVTLIIGEAGSLKGTITGVAESNTVTGNLAEGKTKEGPPQQWRMGDKDPYVIMVYPVWNGIIVQSGGQDAKGTINTSSTYIPKLRAPSIFVQPYSSGFQPTSPGSVEVDCGTPATASDVLVDFGDKMVVTSKNCKFGLAYLPVFFGTQCLFDSWFVANDNQGAISYSYHIYPIYTENRTDYTLTQPAVVDGGFVGPVPNTSYKLANWNMHRAAGTQGYLRFAGEIFGYILETEETRNFVTLNENGNFDITLSQSGTPGNPGAVISDWKKYIQSVQVTIDLDGSNGSVTVDKYGVAGQDAIANQSIGAFTISVTAGSDTQAGSIFQGLAMGIANQETPGNSTWTIPLVGQEKKMDDIALINVPFFDGYTLQVAVDFLCRYAGIDYDMSHANSSIQLSQSSEINVPIFDWKSGTSVKSALDSVMLDTLHSYVVRDGKVYFYALSSTTGLPAPTTQDWSVNYPTTKIINIDKTPDFGNLRNQIVTMALQQMPQGLNTDVSDIPTVPIMELREPTTDPRIYWAKSIFQPLSGSMTQSQLATITDRIAAKTSTYDMGGKVQIPGNALIKPYDMWGSFFIKSVSHDIDLQNKTWTTSLELTKSASI